mgnify:CR=1 FL=1|tara:strand:+ start:781 stop:2145 length:1365 start_codon:yes stop_codon:yes gene_type:complete
MPLIIPANTLSDSGYTIDNSVRFDGSSAYLSRTPSSSGNRSTFTISFWTKISGGFGASSRWIFGAGSGSSDNDYILFPSGDQLKFSFDTESSGNIATSQKFRDPSAWYHVVVAVDTTQGTSSNRVKMYANGNQITSFGTSSYPSQNFTAEINNSGQVQRIGARAYSTTGYFNGYMADFYLIDGQQLAPTEFGETNDNGVWIPKAYDGSFGTNGTHLEFKDSSNLGLATTGNNFTASNLSAIDQCIDSPTNNFCTWNPLIGRAAAYATFAEGNLDADFTSGSVYWRATGSIGVTSGKWYAEIKCIDDGGNTDLKIGVEHASPDQTTIDGVHKVIQSWNGYKASGGSAASFGDSYADGDIVGVLLDMDNGTIKFSKNGTMMASSASAYTDLISAMPESGWAFFAYGYDNANVQANFGNAPFSISSGNADANGYGNFEYAVPSGYYALCTKNLATYG